MMRVVSIVISVLAFCTSWSLQLSYAFEPHWGVCSAYYAGNCSFGRASDDGTFEHLNATGVSVKGLFVFFVEGRYDSANSSGLAEFVFMEKFGDFVPLTETAGRINSLTRMGLEDYRTPAMTLVWELSLIRDLAFRIPESVGSVEKCLTGYPFKSFVISGSERWEIIGRDGTSVCVQVEDTLSLVPGIVRDVRQLGFDIEFGNICGIVRGCSKAPGEVVKIPNFERQGVLRR